MKFEEIYGRTYRGELSQMEAAEILGMSERTFRRWRDRYDADGAEGLYDRRLGKVSARRVPVDTIQPCDTTEFSEKAYPQVPVTQNVDDSGAMKIKSEHRLLGAVPCRISRAL